MTDIDRSLLGFARCLRAAGVPVTADRSQLFLTATSTVGVGTRATTYWAGRSTLCSSRDDLDVYDRLFGAWFDDDGSASAGRSRSVGATEPQVVFGADDSPGDGGDEESVEALRVAASDTEVLRHRDIAGLSEPEKSRLAALFETLHARSPTRTSPRRGPSNRGAVDARATLRRTLRAMGEPVELAWQHRTVRPRRVVALVDVSGSMSSYADAVLRLAHRLARLPVTEVFSVGTRLTRLTPAMRQRDADKALAAAGDAVPDWSGGTRLGEGLQVFLDRYGQRGLARGAVVVLFSDGWERGDASLLAEQMARLHRLAHHVVWVNPHKGLVGYQPVQAGMASALPYVDTFVAGHSLEAFAEVLEVIASA